MRVLVAAVLLSCLEGRPNDARADGSCAIVNTPVLLEPQISDPAGTFGHAVAIVGDWIAVGVPADGEREAGRVELFHFVDDLWTPSGTLAPADSTEGDRFGWALDASEDVIIVGSPKAQGANGRTGAAYVFRLTLGTWVEEQKLASVDGVANDQFGADVSIDGDQVVVGAAEQDELGTAAGAAYVFRHSDEGWQEEQKLLAPDGAAGDLFGRSVEACEGVIAVGAPGDDGADSSFAGSVRIFEAVDRRWMQTRRIAPQDGQYPNAAGFFGELVALRGDALLVRAGFANPAIAGSGILLAYRRVAGTWIDPVLVTSPGGITLLNRSLSLDAQGNSAVWAHVLSDGVAAGIVVHDGAGWRTEQYVKSPVFDPGTGIPTSVASIALDQDRFVMGRTKLFAGGPPFGYAFVCPIPPRDEDQDGLDDECELALAQTQDCDLDGIIDDAQRPYRYFADNGASTGAGLLLNGGYLLLLNHFATSGSTGMVRSVGVMLAKQLEARSVDAAIVLVYSDPNGDGNPADAQLLAAQPFEIDIAQVGDFQDVAFDQPLTLGTAGTSFFAGVALALHDATSTVEVDEELPHRQASWFYWSDRLLDLSTLASNPPVPFDIVGGGSSPVFPRVLMIRAEMADCDESGVLDACEIGAGQLADLDSDGAPDVCEASPPGDLNADGEIGSADLGLLLASWGQCEPLVMCSADLDSSGSVDGADLGLLLQLWSG